MKKPICQRIVLAKPTAVLGALAAAISACYVPQTFAAEEKSVRQIDEVIVTARRRDEMAQDVPISMTVMTEDFIAKNNIEHIEDIGTKVPSLRVTQAGGSLNEPVITLRGQRQGEAAFNQDPAAPIYFNEIVISPNQGGNLGLYDLEGLQVLKGPQGTLFGRNSTGGAVMITPKRPGYKLGGYAELQAGDYDLRGFEGAIDIPLAEKLTTRISAHKLDRDGYQENIANNALHGKRYRDEHSQGVRLAINFEDDAFSNLTVLAQDENKTAAAIPVAGAANHSVALGRSPTYQVAVAEQIARDNPWKVKSDIDAEENIRNVFASNTSEYNINDDLTVKNVFGYRKVFLANASDIDGTELALFGAYAPTALTTDPRLNTINTEFYSDEFQLFGSAFDSKLDWITGLYWSKMAGTEDKLVQQAPGSYDSGLNDILNTSYGVFLEGTYAFTDQWSLTTGIRESQDEREITVRKWSNVARTVCGVYAPGAVPGVNAALANPNCERTVSDTFRSPTWKVSVNYKPEPKVLVYGNISTGYRAGGFNTRGTSDATLKSFDPETVLTYELGHKQDWDIAGIPIRTSLAIYYQDYQDIQNTVSTTEGTRLVTRTENAAKAEISGLEFETTVKPTDDLTFNFSYSYVDAQFKDRTALIAGKTVDTSNDEFTYIPKQSLTASTTYTLPLDHKFGEVSLTGGVYWQDEMSTHPYVKQFNLYGWANSDVVAMTKFSRADEYTVWNFRADWRSVMGSTFDVAAYVDNATNEKYILGGLNVVDSGGYGAYHYGAPRTIGASVKYSF